MRWETDSMSWFTVLLLLLFPTLEEPRFVDVTQEAGLAGIKAHGVSWGDYDEDGDLDVFLAGKNQVWLYRNTPGRFEDVTAATGLDQIKNSETGGGGYFADYDNDGDLDLFVAPHNLMRNSRGTFTQVSQRSGIVAVNYRVQSEPGVM